MDISKSQQIIEQMLPYITRNTTLNKTFIWLTSIAIGLTMPVLPMLMVCYVAMAIDTYYGIKVALALKNKVESRRTWTGLFKKVRDVSIIMLLLHAIELYIIGKDSMFAVVVVVFATLVCANEVLSIAENLNTIDPHGPWKVFGKYLKKKGTQTLDIDLEELTDKPNDTTTTPTEVKH